MFCFVFLQRMQTRRMGSPDRSWGWGTSRGLQPLALVNLERWKNPTNSNGVMSGQVRGGGNAGLGPWALPPGAWRGVAGACCWGGFRWGRLRAWPPPGPRGPRPLPREAQPQGQGVLWPQVLGGLPPAHHDAKSGTRYHVSGCMDSVCARLCRWAAGTPDGLVGALQRIQGRGERG